MEKKSKQSKDFGDYLIGELENFTFSENFKKKIKLEIKKCYGLESNKQKEKLDLVAELLNNKINEIYPFYKEIKDYCDYLIGELENFTFSEYFIEKTSNEIKKCYGLESSKQKEKLDFVADLLNDKITEILLITSKEKVDKWYHAN
jgi:cell division protein ZapA (FtsZ GTPase activity inhibitor)